MKEIDLIIRNRKILCYLNYINYLSRFDKRKNVVITNHENIFFTVYIFYAILLTKQNLNIWIIKYLWCTTRQKYELRK